MAFGAGLNGSLDTSQKGWVDQTMNQMRGGDGTGAGLANGLNNGQGLQSAGNWVDQQINQMKGGQVNPAAMGIDVSSQGAANWVSQVAGGAAGGGLGSLGSSLGGGPQLGALGGNFGGDPLQPLGQTNSNNQLMQMLGSAGMGPGGGLGAANPLSGLV